MHVQHGPLVERITLHRGLDKGEDQIYSIIDTEIWARKKRAEGPFQATRPNWQVNGGSNLTIPDAIQKEKGAGRDPDKHGTV